MVQGEIQEAKTLDSRYFSRAVAKSLFLLDLLNASASALGLSEMAGEAGLTKTSVYRLLHTLEHLHYVEQHQDGRYVIGTRGKTDPATRVANVLRSIELPVQDLLAQFNETVNVAALFTNHIEVVRVFESTRVLRMANTIGRILSPHASSLGKAITAFQTEEIQRQLLLSYGIVRFTAHTITDETALRKEFQTTRKRGYSWENGESTIDGCCLGAPVMSRDGTTIAGISISLPKSRMPGSQERTEMAGRLQETATALSRVLARDLLQGEP